MVSARLRSSIHASADDRTWSRSRLLALVIAALAATTAPGCLAPDPAASDLAPAPASAPPAPQPPATSPSPPPSSPAPPTTAATPPAPQPVPDPLPATGDPKTIDTNTAELAERARGTVEGKQAAAAALRAGATGRALWGAVYTYSANGDDPALLAPLLTHDDATIRVLAAGGLLRMGQRSGFEVLVAETRNADLLAGSEPPQSIGEISALMLSMASGENFDITPNAASQKAWNDWYAAHADRLTFDAAKGWSTP